MTSHGEWFKDIRDLKTPGFVETGDDTIHPITKNWQSAIVHARWVNKIGQTKYLKYVFHVPTITKKLVSIGQMAEQGL